MSDTSITVIYHGMSLTVLYTKHLTILYTKKLVLGSKEVWLRQVSLYMLH